MRNSFSSAEFFNFSEKEMLKVIEGELLTLLDDTMFTGFAESLSTTRESTWISLVKGALQTWLLEQQQISKLPSLIDEQVTLIAAELTKIDKTFETDELHEYVTKKYEMITEEDRIPFLSERFRKFIGEEYVKLEAGTNLSKLSEDEIVTLLLQKVLLLAKVQEIKLAREKLAKISATTPTDVLDEEYMKLISEQLLKFSEEEFNAYVMDVIADLEVLGVEEVDMNMLYQLYLLLKQELFSLIATTVMKATSKERIEITSYGLTRILEGKELIEEESVFGQIFLVLATGTAVLAEEKSVNVLDDVLLRDFVRKEFEGLRDEHKLKLKYEGYIKFIMDEVIKLVGDINLAKNDAGELLFSKVVNLIATQFLLFAEDEMKIIAERLVTKIEEESEKLQKIADESKMKFRMYDDDKLQKLSQLIEEELFAITAKSLVDFTEKQTTELVEEGLSLILAEKFSKLTEKPSTFGRVFDAIAEELSKLTSDEVAGLKDEDLTKLVKFEFEKTDYGKSIQLFEEMCLMLIADEFVQLVKQQAVMIFADEEEKHQFGEMARLIARRFLYIAEYQSDYLS